MRGTSTHRGSARRSIGVCDESDGGDTAGAPRRAASTGRRSLPCCAAARSSASARCRPPMPNKHPRRPRPTRGRRRAGRSNYPRSRSKRPLAAAAAPGCRRPAPTATGSTPTTSRICRPARTPRSPTFLPRCRASQSIRTSRSTSAIPKVLSSNIRSTGPWFRSISIPTRRSSRCSIRCLCPSMDLLDGVLPSRYSYATGGVVDIQTKEGQCADPGGSFSILAGQRGTLQPSVQYAGCDGKLSYYVSGLYDQGDTAFSPATPGPGSDPQLDQPRPGIRLFFLSAQRHHQAQRHHLVGGEQQSAAEPSRSRPAICARRCPQFQLVGDQFLSELPR